MYARLLVIDLRSCGVGKFDCRFKLLKNVDGVRDSVSVKTKDFKGDCTFVKLVLLDEL